MGRSVGMWRWMRLPRGKPWPLRVDELDKYLPGEHILETMDERGWDVAHLADALGLCENDADALLSGRMRVEPDLAGRLAGVIGATAVYWMNLQETYDDAAA